MWRGVIEGEPASKANSRRLVTFGKRPASIKSAKALAYVAHARRQINAPAEPIEGDVIFTATIHYATRRPDLDESLILDVLQAAGVIRNDRQVREKHVYWALDRERPRAEIEIKLR